MRFCTRCGAEVAEGQRFCRRCGNELRPKVDEKGEGLRPEDVMPAGDECAEEPGDEMTVRFAEEAVRAKTDATDAPFRQLTDAGGGADMRSVASGADATAEDAASEPPKRWKHTAAIVGIAVAVVLGLGVGVTLWLLGRLPVPSPLVELSESADMVAVSRTSRVVPKSASGETPSHYYVRVRRAIDDNGKDIDVSSLSELEVEDGEGFTPNQIISDLPDGTYTFEIDDGDQVFTLPPVEIDDTDGSLPDNITIQMQPDQGTEAPQHAGDEEPKTTDELFLDKIGELEKEYGAPEVKVQPYGEQYLSYASGLAYAGLFDFGDGAERLVTLCLSQEAQVEWNHADYLIQVWEYDEKEGKLVCVLNKADVSFAAAGWSGSFSINPVSRGPLLYLWADATDGGELGKNIELYFGLQDGGSFGLIHEFSQECVTYGDGDEFTYHVDGTEVSADASFSIKREMERGLDPDASQSMYPQAIFSNEDEARSAKFVNATEMLTGSFYYPGDLVELVAETKRTLQKRIDGEADGSSALADLSQCASNDVTVTVRDEDVTYPTYNSGATSDGTSTETWTYVQMSGPDVGDDIASSINAALKQEFEEAKSQSQTWSFETGSSGQCLSYRSFVTFSRAGVTCVRVQKYCTGWGPHGWMEITDHVFDLRTGGEISPFGIVGLSEDEAKQRAVDCIVDYVLLHPGAMPYESEAEARSDAEELVKDAQFFLNDDGLAVYLPEYAMGYTYQQGVKEILVWAFDDQSLIGTDVHGLYSERTL